LNVYLPVGDDRKQIGGNLFTGGTTFSGQTVLLDRLRQFEVAMSGLDLELGGPLLFFDQFTSRQKFRGYVGTYYFSADESKDLWGVKGRLEVDVHDMVDCNWKSRMTTFTVRTLSSARQFSSPGTAAPII